VFEGIPERNIVTWNAMLNGYVKAGMMDLAEELLWRTPERDVVSWLTIIDGYIRSDLVSNALKVYIHMLGEVDTNDNEALLVDLLKACTRHLALMEGQQFHTVTNKTFTLIEMEDDTRS
jgi:hypothetical protein